MLAVSRQEQQAPRRSSRKNDKPLRVSRREKSPPARLSNPPSSGVGQVMSEELLSATIEMQFPPQPKRRRRKRKPATASQAEPLVVDAVASSSEVDQSTGAPEPEAVETMAAVFLDKLEPEGSNEPEAPDNSDESMARAFADETDSGDAEMEPEADSSDEADATAEFEGVVEVDNEPSKAIVEAPVDADPADPDPAGFEADLATMVASDEPAAADDDSVDDFAAAVQESEPGSVPQPFDPFAESQTEAPQEALAEPEIAAAPVALADEASEFEPVVDELIEQLDTTADGNEFCEVVEANGELGSRLNQILESLETMQTGEASQPLQTQVEQLGTNLAQAEARHDAVDSSVRVLSEDVKAIRTQLAAASEVTQSSAKTVAEISGSLAGMQIATEIAAAAAVAGAEQPVSKPAETPWDTRSMVIGVGVLLMSWSMMFYLKTGNTLLALAGLVIANLAGCAAILLGRGEDQARE